MFKTALVALSLVACASAALAGPIKAKVAASPGFDGKWSILVMTEKGTCDSAYRYAIRIENGEARYEGGTDFTVTGNVTQRGAVKGSIARGSDRADVVGKLDGEFGQGTWSTSGATPCGGSWSAERRG